MLSSEEIAEALDSYLTDYPMDEVSKWVIIPMSLNKEDIPILFVYLLLDDKFAHTSEEVRRITYNNQSEQTALEANGYDGAYKIWFKDGTTELWAWKFGDYTLEKFEMTPNPRINKNLASKIRKIIIDAQYDGPNPSLSKEVRDKSLEVFADKGSIGIHYTAEEAHPDQIREELTNLLSSELEEFGKVDIYLDAYDRSGNEKYYQISEKKKMTEAASKKYEVYFNTNWSCRTRGTDSDQPSMTETFKDVRSLLTFLDEESIIYLEDEEWAGHYKLNSLSDDAMDDLIEACNEVDVTGGDTVVFYIKNLQNGVVRETDWDSTDFEMEDEEWEGEEEFMNDLRIGFRKEPEGYTRVLSVENEEQVANVAKVFGDSPEYKEAYDAYVKTGKWNPNPYTTYPYGDVAGRQRYENWEAGWRVAAWDLKQAQ